MSNFDRDKCVEVMEKLRNKIKDRITGTIWHYTKAEGFKGIIESKEIWMTNALFVNDKMELRASFEGSDIPKDFQFKNPQFDSLKGQRRLQSEDNEDHYLASFSKKDDYNSLGQFRAYGNYCIGFDAKELKKKRFSLFRCVYEKKDIMKWLINKDKLVDLQNECSDNKKCKSYKGAAFYDVKYAMKATLKNMYYKAEIHQQHLLQLLLYSPI